MPFREHQARRNTEVEVGRQSDRLGGIDHVDGIVGPRKSREDAKNFVLTGRLIAIYKVALPAECPCGTLRATGGVAGQT